MNNIEASFNFPNGFLWGNVTSAKIISDKTYQSLIHTLHEKHINALLFSISWSQCEPLKGSFDEPYVDSIRLFLSRVQSQNITPVIILNVRDFPSWKNLEDRSRSRNLMTDEYNFAARLIQSTCTYTNFYVLEMPNNTGNMNGFVSLFKDISEYTHRLSDNCKTGLFVNNNDYAGKSIFSKWKQNLYFRITEKTHPDFLFVRASGKFLNTICNSLFVTEKPPIALLSEVTDVLEQEKSVEILTDELFDFWHMYQNGWPIMGFFIDILSVKSKELTELYENSCIENAFRISTQMS